MGSRLNPTSGVWGSGLPVGSFLVRSFFGLLGWPRFFIGKTNNLLSLLYFVSCAFSFFSFGSFRINLKTWQILMVSGWKGVGGFMASWISKRINLDRSINIIWCPSILFEFCFCLIFWISQLLCVFFNQSWFLGVGHWAFQYRVWSLLFFNKRRN